MTKSLRILFSMALALWAVPADAHMHFAECFSGVSPEKEDSLAFRASCGVRLWGSTAVTSSGSVRRLFPFIGRGGQAVPSVGDPSIPGTPRLVRERSLFIVGEVAEYVLGKDSGEKLDGWMVGPRYRFNDGGIEPFAHVMAGRQHPARPTAATGSTAPTESFAMYAVGGGVDIVFTGASAGFVFPFRIQFDLIESGAKSGLHPYGRATFGITARYETRK